MLLRYHIFRTIDYVTIAYGTESTSCKHFKFFDVSYVSYNFT